MQCVLCVLEQLSKYSILLALLSALWGIHTWRKQRQVERAKFLKTFVDFFYENKEMREILYSIEHNRITYSAESRSIFSSHGVDAYLAYIDMLCGLKNNHVVNNKEFSSVIYLVRSVCECKAIRNYFSDLYWDLQKDMAEIDGIGKQNPTTDSRKKVFPYANIVKYAEKHGIFKKKFLKNRYDGFVYLDLDENKEKEENA